MAVTLEIVLRGGLEDVHAGYILERWAAADKHSQESLLTFTREALVHLSTHTHEPLDVVRVAPEVRNLLVDIREQGLRAVLARRYALKEPTPPDQRM